MLITFDDATERLYVYATLLSHIPADAVARSRLLEVLMEGAMLGREMAGGGVGMSLRSDMVYAILVDRHAPRRHWRSKGSHSRLR